MRKRHKGTLVVFCTQEAVPEVRETLGKPPGELAIAVADFSSEESQAQSVVDAIQTLLGAKLHAHGAPALIN